MRSAKEGLHALAATLSDPNLDVASVHKILRSLKDLETGLGESDSRICHLSPQRLASQIEIWKHNLSVEHSRRLTAQMLGTLFVFGSDCRNRT